MAVTGAREVEVEVTLTFVMSAAEVDVWDTFGAEHGLALADVVHLAALSGLKYQAKAAGDEIKALVAERCERAALEVLGKPSRPGPGMRTRGPSQGTGDRGAGAGESRLKEATRR